MNVGENANACYSYNLDKTHSLAELNKRWRGNSDPENPEFTYEDVFDSLHLYSMYSTLRFALK